MLGDSRVTHRECRKSVCDGRQEKGGVVPGGVVKVRGERTRGWRGHRGTS